MFHPRIRVPLHPNLCPKCGRKPYPAGWECKCGYIGAGPKRVPPQFKGFSWIVKTIWGLIAFLAILWGLQVLWQQLVT